MSTPITPLDDLEFNLNTILFPIVFYPHVRLCTIFFTVSSILLLTILRANSYTYYLPTYPYYPLKPTYYENAILSGKDSSIFCNLDFNPACYPDGILWHVSLYCAIATKYE